MDGHSLSFIPRDLSIQFRQLAVTRGLWQRKSELTTGYKGNKKERIGEARMAILEAPVPGWRSVISYPGMSVRIDLFKGRAKEGCSLRARVISVENL